MTPCLQNRGFILQFDLSEWKLADCVALRGELATDIIDKQFIRDISDYDHYTFSRPHAAQERVRGP